MLQVQFTLRNKTYHFEPRSWLAWGAAAIGAGVLLAAYIGALHQSVARGEALRQLQRSGHPAAVAIQPLDLTRSGPRKLVALSR